MRTMIKGGLWKNTEDEILKAAVMKYGKYQWSRVSSLLVRKSAKQCKARWYEWLEPSIKKIEWTREEDEKLLQLAKFLPSQWRTIAPIVGGRTPAQCLERYEKILDAACAQDGKYEPGDYPRKLRPGEVDPNPESKPARPDPVDMDEDEKEMLAEARARLTNTKGKKAKRKAREKHLEEARRLASLQKRREMKAAGIDDTRHGKRKMKGIDYNAEIPFSKKPLPGFYDVTDEENRPPMEQQPIFPITIEQLEGERRVDKEARLRKQDVARNKIAQRQDAPSAIMQANKLNHYLEGVMNKRSKLNLPSPQISDQELEEIAKIGVSNDHILESAEELTEGNAGSRALLTSYSRTPQEGIQTLIRTPQRTPASKRDGVMMEAENQRRLTQSQTPLLGGENPILHPSDFTGVTPNKKRKIQTPNPLLMTPSAAPGDSSSRTPGMTPKRTPIRDELHINADKDIHSRKELLRSSLKNLPEPKNEYQIAIQPISEYNEEPEEKIEEDMSDRIARENSEEEATRQALLRKRSKVLQRQLPRPPATSLDLIRNSLKRKAEEDKNSLVPSTVIEQADEVITRELLSLLEHDNAKYPLDNDELDKEKKRGKKRKPTPIPVIEDFEDYELREADSLINEEAKFLCKAMVHEDESNHEDGFFEAHQTCLNDIIYFPKHHSYGLSSVSTNMDTIAALQNEFENVKEKLDVHTKKAQSLENKIKILTNGYQMRAGKLWAKIETMHKQMNAAEIELRCFQALQKQEQLAASNRINNLWEEVQKQKELERALQEHYGLLGSS